MSPDPHHYRYLVTVTDHGAAPFLETHASHRLSKGFFANALLGLIILVVVGFIGAVLLFALVGRNLPDPNALQDRSVAQSTKIYDRTGEHLFMRFTVTKSERLYRFPTSPPQVVQAFLSAEDDDLPAQRYRHTRDCSRDARQCGLGKQIARRLNAHATTC